MATSFHRLTILHLLPVSMPFPCSVSLQFKMSRFYPDSEIDCQGDAVLGIGGIEFNSIVYGSSVGWATYAEPLRLWDSKTTRLTDFTSHCSFNIDTRNSTSYGHGLAFFLAPLGFNAPLNSAGGFLGLFNTTSPDYSGVVSVEFDSYANPEWDPPYGHVGINNNSIASALVTPWNASLHSEDLADVWIIYNGTTKNLSVSWSYQRTSTPEERSSLSYYIDLMKVLPERVTIGFSAATDMNVERHTLYSWEFNSTLNVKESSATKTKVVVAVTASACVSVAGAVIIFAVLWRQNQKGKQKEIQTNLVSGDDDLENIAGPRKFTYKDLFFATKNFSEDRKLGQGGFGAVYQGYLADLDMFIAVKKISRGSKQGKKQYITEVKVIRSLRHRNLVQLIGWCHDGGEFSLVYEFMPNGSLDSHLFHRKSHLSWNARYKITLGLASALFYLHQECEQCVVHHDIKSSNVMLDSNFNAKLGDFGLARLMDHELGPQKTGLAGTFGYMAPEYISTGKASKETDIFSFGVVVLEIATGRKAAVRNEENPRKGLLVERVWDMYESGELLLAVDEALQKDFDEEQAKYLMIVGLWCAHPDYTMRPSMRQALQVLHFEAGIPVLPGKMPVSLQHMPTPSASSCEPSMTLSLVMGR